MPGDSGVTVVTTLACYFLHARLRAHRAPGIPCALFAEGAGPKSKPRAKTRGEIAKSCPVRSLPPRALARGGVRGEQSSLSRSGAGVYSAGTAASVYAAPPPPPTPPRRFAGGRGATAVAIADCLKVESSRVDTATL